MPQKTHSTIEPPWYFLDEIKSKDDMPVLIIRINWGTEEIEIPEPEPHIEYQYNSIVIVHKPTLILEESDIRTYIETHETELKEEALNQWNALNIPNADITEIREQPLVPNFEERVFHEREVYGATVVEIDVSKPNKRYVNAKLLNREVTKWCYVTGSIYRDYQEGKIDVGDTVVVAYVNNQYPIIIDRVIL